MRGLHQEHTVVGSGEVVLWWPHAPHAWRRQDRKGSQSLDIETGKTAWESRICRRDSGKRTDGHCGGLVFYGDDAGAFVAADAKTGKLLWSFKRTRVGRRGR